LGTGGGQGVAVGLGSGEGVGKGLAVEESSPALTPGRYIVYGVAGEEGEDEGDADGSDTGDSEVGTVVRELTPQPMMAAESRTMTSVRLTHPKLREQIGICVPL
jgi:hypothetical protein